MRGGKFLSRGMALKRERGLHIFSRAWFAYLKRGLHIFSVFVWQSEGSNERKNYVRGIGLKR